MPSGNFLDYKSIINHVPLNSTNLVTLDKSKPVEQCPLTPLLNALEVNKFSSKNSQKIALIIYLMYHNIQELAQVMVHETITLFIILLIEHDLSIPGPLQL